MPFVCQVDNAVELTPPSDWPTPWLTAAARGAAVAAVAASAGAGIVPLRRRVPPRWRRIGL